MTGMVQLYQQLSARAKRYFVSDDTRSVIYVHTEITVEHEQRLWLVGESPRRAARSEEPETAEAVQRDAKVVRSLPSSTKKSLKGELL